MSTSEETSVPEFEIALTGEVDLARQAELVNLRRGFQDSTYASVVVDLSDVTFLDSTGLSFLADLRHVAEGRDGRVTLRQPSPAALRTLKVVAFDEVFEIRH
jgi:anti-sigma B factor antagonist